MARGDTFKKKNSFFSWPGYCEKKQGFCICFYFLFLDWFGFFFPDRFSLYNPGCPGSHSVDQAGLKLKNSPASAFQVLGLQACATTARLKKVLTSTSCLMLCLSIGRTHGKGHPLALNSETVSQKETCLYHMISLGVLSQQWKSNVEH